MFIHREDNLENDLEVRNFRCEGLLDDGVSDSSAIEKLYDYLAEDPLGSSMKLTLCGLSGKNMGDCVVEVGKEACKSTGDTELCDMVEKAELVNEAQKALLKKDDTPASTFPSADDSSREKLRSELNGVLDVFKDVPCKELSSEQRLELTSLLNKYESGFRAADMQSEFEGIISKLKCDVVEEFKCGGKDDSVVQFVVDPICKPRFIHSWGRPVLTGGATGAIVGVGFHKIAKGPVTHSIIAGLIACAGVTYYLHNRVMTEYEEKMKEVL